MAFRQEEFTFTTSSLTTSQNLAFDAAVGANSLLVAILVHADGPTTKSLSSVTDTLGNTWTPSITAINTAGLNDCSLSVYYCLSSSAGACTATLVANAGAGTTWWYIVEFDTVSSFDTSDTNSLSLNTTSGTQPFPHGVSGAQTVPGLMIAINVCNPQASAFDTPTGFTPLGLITSANRTYYRYSAVAVAYADVISNMQSSSAGNLDVALGIVSFITSTPTEITDNFGSVCCSEGQNEVVNNTGGGTANGANPFQTPLIGTAIGCVGGGTVPTQADITYSETWWGA
jgi:hypothetical protein